MWWGRGGRVPHRLLLVPRVHVGHRVFVVGVPQVRHGRFIGFAIRIRGSVVDCGGVRSCRIRCRVSWRDQLGYPDKWVFVGFLLVARHTGSGFVVWCCWASEGYRHDVINVCGYVG